MDFNGAKKYIVDRLQTELDKKLYYHGLHHTLDVYESAIRIAELEHLDEDALLLLKTAALYHDSGFIHQSADHEAASVLIASNILPSFGYTPEQIETVSGMIMATKLPQTPQTHLEEIICDADLDYLGREDFPIISEMLFDEFLSRNIVSDKKNWNSFQAKFFRSHNYFTQSARELRGPKKQEWLEYLEGKR